MPCSIIAITHYCRISNMTQDELWLVKWQEAIDFLETNHRKPSKFIPEERNMRSWWKHNKKLMNAGELKPERVEMFERLLDLGEKYKHVNQYQWRYQFLCQPCRDLEMGSL